MIPVLYKKDEQQFRSYGLGELSDFVETPEVKRERNGQYTFYMKYELDGVLANELEEGMKIKSDAGPRTSWQTFEINRIVTKSDEHIEIFANHISMRTAKDALRPRVRATNVNGQQLLQTWRNNLVGDDHWEVWSDITTTVNVEWEIEDFNNAREVLGGRTGSILDRIGGEYEFDNQTIRLWRQMGRTAPTVLEYGRNIKTIEKENQEDSIYTSIYPFATYTPEGQDTVAIVTLPEFYVDSEYIDMYDHRKIQVVDFTTEFDFENQPTVEALRSLAEQYIENNEVGSPWENTKVEYEDLSKTLDYADFQIMEEVELNDIVPVWYPKLKITNSNAKVVVTVYDPVRENYKSIELGVIGQRLGHVLNRNTNERLDRVEKEQRYQHTYIVNAAGNRIWYSTPPDDIEHRVGDLWFEQNGQYTRLRIWNGNQWIVQIDTEDIDVVSQRVEEAISEAQEAKAQVERESEDRRADIQAESERLSAEWNERIEENEQIVEGVRHSTEELMNDFDRALSQANFTSIEDLTTTLNSRSLEAIENARESIEIAERADGHALEALDVANGIGTRMTDVESTVEGQTASINTAIATAERVEQELTRVEEAAEGARVVANRVEETAEGFERTISEVRGDLDGLSIGGRNILYNSNFSRGFDEWYTGGGTVTRRFESDEVFSSYLSFEVTGTTTPTGILQSTRDDGRIKNGETYTLSLYLKSEEAQTVWVALDGSMVNNATSFVTTPNWTKYTFTRTSSGGNNIFRIYHIGSTSAPIDVANIKLELGNKATDWTPAPEDYETRFVSMEADIEGITNTVSDYEGRISRTEQRADGLYDVVHDPNTGLLTEVGQIAEGWQVTAQRIDDLSVGGRNYIKGTHTNGNSQLYKITRVTNSYSSFDGLTIDFAQLAGKTVTFTYRVKTDFENGHYRIETRSNPWFRLVPTRPLIDGETVSVTRTIPENIGTNERIQLFSTNIPSGVEIDFELMKLELGNKATDWTPAPEDMATQTQLSVLHNAIDLAVEEGDVVGRLNIQAGHTLIQNGEILMDADTVRFTGSAFIPNAAIEEVTANKIIGSDGQFNTLRSRFLTSNVIEADHLRVTTAMIDRFFANRALIERLTSQQAFIDDIQAIEISADKITAGTLNAANVNLINVNAQSIAGNEAELITALFNSDHSQLRLSGSSVAMMRLNDNSGYAFELTSNEARFDLPLRMYAPLYMRTRPLYLGNDRNNQYIQSEGNTLQFRSGASEDNVQLSVRPSEINAFTTMRLHSNLDMRQNQIFYSSQAAIRSQGNTLQFRIDATTLMSVGDNNIHMWRQLNMNGHTITNSPSLSDERLKEFDWESDEDSLSIVRSWKLGRYRFNKKAEQEFGLIGHNEFGLSAQSTPDLMTYTADTDIYGVNHLKWTARNSHAIQQLAKEHENTLKVASHAYLLAEQHEDELACYKKKIEELEKKVKRLEGAA